jgi:hypothetical protein
LLSTIGQFQLPYFFILGGMKCSLT